MKNIIDAISRFFVARRKQAPYNPRDNPIVTKYSADEEHRYEIVKRADGIFQVWVQEKIYDDYYDGRNEFIVWGDIKDVIHLTDTLERAQEIGDEYLTNFEQNVI